MRNFMRKTARTVSDAQPSNWASLCLNSDIFSFCSNHGPQIRSMRLSSVGSTSAFNCRAPSWRTSGGATRARLRWPSVPRLLWSGASPAPRRRLHHCGAAAAASRHAAPPAPRRDQARRRPATRPPAPLRVQVHHARPPPVESAEPLGLKAPTAASRSPMHAALARSPEPAPAGGRARCWPDHQLRANFPGARAAQSASPPRSGARRKKWAWWGTGRTRFATEVDTKVFYGENLFCRQSRETCESGLRSRRSRSASHCIAKPL